MPNRYRVVLHGRPAARLPDKTNIHLNFPSEERGMVTVLINELRQDFNGVDVPVGLIFDTDVSAETMDQAMIEANKTADGVASFVTLVTGVGIPLIKPVQCMEVTEGKTERDHIQFFDDIPVAEASRHVLDPTSFINVFEKYSNLADKEVTERVARAVRWYRQGTIKADPFDRFASYWIGLEAVNQALQDSLGVVERSERCKTCGYKPVSTTLGIKEFTRVNFDDSGKLFTSLRRQRGKIVHSNNPLSAMVGDVQELTPSLGKILFAAINYLCGIPPPWTFPKEILTNSNPARAALVSKVVSEKAEDAFLDDGKFPYWTAVHKLESLEHRSDEKTTATTTTTFTAVIGKNARFTTGKLRAYGEGESEVKVTKASKTEAATGVVSAIALRNDLAKSDPKDEKAESP